MVTRTRPGLLTAFCVLAVLLGIGGLWKGWRAVTSNRMVADWVTEEGQSEELAQLREETLRAIRAATDDWRVLSTPLVVLNLAVGACLILGGTMALRFRPVGRIVLLATFVAAIAYEILTLVSFVAICLAASDIYVRYAQRSAELHGTYTTDMPQETFNAALTTGLYLGMAFGIALGLLKITFYVFGILYFRKPGIRALYSVQH